MGTTPTAVAPASEVPSPPMPTVETKIRGSRKAAILLSVLDQEQAATLLRSLTDEEVCSITREISLLSKVTGAERTAVLEGFMSMVELGNVDSRRGMEYATTLLVSAFGPEAGQRIAQRILKSIGTNVTSLESLQKSDPQHLASVIQREQPQAIALILSHLGPAHASKVIEALPAGVRADVVKRMGLLDQISPEVVNRITKTISAKLRLGGQASFQAYGGVRAVAEILNRVESATTDEILKEVTEQDQGLAEAIRNLMFVFEDLLHVDQHAMKTLLGSVNKKVLVLALKGASPQTRQYFTSFMSKRAMEMLTEDMQALGPVKLRDVQEAQQEIIRDARRLESEGTISLKPSAGDQMIE